MYSRHQLRWPWRVMQRRGHTSATQTVGVQTAPQPCSAIPGPPRLPLVGTLWLYKTGKYDMSRYHEVLRSLCSQYGPLVQQQLGAKTVMHVFDPDLAKQVHQKEGKYPTVPPLQEAVLIFRKMHEFSLGLGNTNGKTWYQLRSGVQQLMMRPLEFSCFLPMQDAVAVAFADRVAAEAATNATVPTITQLVFHWVFESAAFLCTERRLGALSGGAAEARVARLVAANRQVARVGMRLKFSLFRLYKYISTPEWRRLAAAEEYFSRFAVDLFESTIADIEKRMDAGELRDGDYKFLCYMLSRPNMSKKDIIITALSMVTDGLSTTVPTFLAALWCLANTPDAQQKLYEEACTVLPEGPSQPIRPELLSRLPYAKAVLKETLRLYPIGTELSRILESDIELAGYMVPAGTQIDMHQWVHLRSPEHFSDPDVFRPDRWLRGQKQDVHPYLHIPFGHGTRMCVGRRFAEQDFYVALVRLVQRVRLLPRPGPPLRQIYETLLMPDKPIAVDFERR